MADHQQHIESDPKSLEASQKFWATFMNAMKYSVIAIVVVLALMGFFLV